MNTFLPSPSAITEGMHVSQCKTINLYIFLVQQSLVAAYRITECFPDLLYNLQLNADTVFRYHLCMYPPFFLFVCFCLLVVKIYSSHSLSLISFLAHPLLHFLTSSQTSLLNHPSACSLALSWFITVSDAFLILKDTFCLNCGVSSPCLTLQPSTILDYQSTWYPLIPMQKLSPWISPLPRMT